MFDNYHFTGFGRIYCEEFASLSQYYLVAPLKNRWNSRNRERGKIFAALANDSQPEWTRKGGKERTLKLGANLLCIGL